MEGEADGEEPECDDGAEEYGGGEDYFDGGEKLCFGLHGELAFAEESAQEVDGCAEEDGDAEEGGDGVWVGGEGDGCGEGVGAGGEFNSAPGFVGLEEGNGFAVELGAGVFVVAFCPDE